VPFASGQWRTELVSQPLLPKRSPPTGRSMNDLTKHEIKTLEMLAGRREEERGAVMSMCLDYLRGRGYCTPGPNHTITSAGLAVLAKWDAGGIADAS
jgi:hypothetical protein